MIDFCRRDDERWSQTHDRILMQGPAKDQAGGETVLHKAPGRLRGGEVHADQEAAPPHSRETSRPAEGSEFAQKFISSSLSLLW